MLRCIHSFAAALRCVAQLPLKADGFFYGQFNFPLRFFNLRSTFVTHNSEHSPRFQIYRTTKLCISYKIPISAGVTQLPSSSAARPLPQSLTHSAVSLTRPQPRPTNHSRWSLSSVSTPPTHNSQRIHSLTACVSGSGPLGASGTRPCLVSVSVFVFASCVLRLCTPSRDCRRLIDR